MASVRKFLFACAAAAGATASPELTAIAAVGACGTNDQSGCGKAASDHVLLQLSDASRVSRAGTALEAAEEAEECKTSEAGEQCYAAVEWAMQHGIQLHPEWYPGLTEEASFLDFQEFLAGKKLHDCPKPCDLCHTAVKGEECYDAVVWAKEHGMKLHPEWYIGLTYGASFEEFQAYLHHAGVSSKGEPHAGCPMPCHLCRTISEEGEPCFTDLSWAMEYGIKLHPKWYPGLSEDSTRMEFQHYLNTKGMCPRPCGECHTAVKGERCHTGVTWAMEHGIHQKPEWYKELTVNSTFEEFQQHLHLGKYEQCPPPCM